MKATLSVTEAVRNFADLINRIAYRGEQFTLERGGKPVARMIPVPQAGRLGELPEIMASIPELGPEEAEAMAQDLAEALADLPSPTEADPWVS